MLSGILPATSYRSNFSFPLQNKPSHGWKQRPLYSEGGLPPDGKSYRGIQNGHPPFSVYIFLPRSYGTRPKTLSSGRKDNITAEIQTVQVFYLFNHNGRTISLADKAVYFGMSFFTVNHQLCIIFTRLLITFMYLPLQLEHDRTRCIDDRYLILLCNLVGRRRFSMCTKQDFFPFQLRKFMVIDSA